MKLSDSKLHDLYDTAYSWLILHGTTLFISIIVLLIGLRVIKFIGTRLRGRMSKRKVHSSLQPFFLSLTLTALYVLLIIGVAGINGISVSSFSAVLGGFTVAVGLALSGTFQNFAGGVLILLLKPFELEDSIIAQGQDGKVISIQIFYTVLITADNKTVIIPNGKLFNEVIINVTREGKRRLDFEIKIGYAADVEQVLKVIEDSIKSNNAVLKDAGNRVGVSALEVDGVKYMVNVWVAPADVLNTRLALHEKILIDLRAAAVKLPGM
ncbi:mechanosensitive ion channel family protein [Mucilaginibacter sp. UR6-11]|uniref:mechanosensitive ion channel family protein n=1 Tax=Mucilaginibacter sp. UR6-11 TaxID=1435644 RepID=UPI001E39FC67|nr:mechanosensitive ion channel domain-containing protein [Mucilaginibacter sp. UR6-11]MCC8425208.1 mechanosensitive ion channel [Mucilaginibacter sp. UR6-11]